MLPSELISHIMKNCDLNTKTCFLLVNKELYREAKRQLMPLITIKDDTRIEAIQGKEYMIVSVYIVGEIEGFNNGGKEYLRSRKYFKRIDGKWKLHRENKPAVTEWHWNDQKAYEKWYKDGKQSRDNGPAETRWELSGVTFKKWFRNGQLHRNKKPAVEQWDENGVKFYEAWYKNDRLIKNKSLNRCRPR